MKKTQITTQLYKAKGLPLLIPPRFEELWECIATRRYPRVNVIAPTQDGKSLTIASAVTTLVASSSERVTILAPSDKKADIIMGEIREFATQNPIIYSQLELDKNDTLDRLKRERSKRHLIFKRGGGVQTVTLDARNSKRSMEAAMGFGSKNIIEDEAGLIDDALHSTVMRMMGGYKYEDTMLIKVGNPFFRNHFYKSSINQNYHQIKHTYRESIRDFEAGFHGFDPLFIEEMRDEAFFDVYYECNFPNADEVDSLGFRNLILQDSVKVGTVEPVGVPVLGCDIGGGGDLNVYIKRWPNFAKVVGYNQSNDTMTNVSEVERLLEEDPELKPENVNIDDTGIGRGVVDRLKEKGLNVNGVSVGFSAKEKNKYANIKAELSWRGRNWIIAENTIEPDNRLTSQLYWPKYKINSDKLLVIESKADLKKRTGKSPDFADAFFLTFYEKSRGGIIL